MKDIDNEGTFELNDELYVKAPQTITAPADRSSARRSGNCGILEKIKRRGTALIYKAHNTPFDLDRVIKILKPSLIDDEDFFQRFQAGGPAHRAPRPPQCPSVFSTPGEVQRVLLHRNGIHHRPDAARIHGRQPQDRRARYPVHGFSNCKGPRIRAQRAASPRPPAKPSTASSTATSSPKNIMITGGKAHQAHGLRRRETLSITSNTMQGRSWVRSTICRPNSFPAGNSTSAAISFAGNRTL